LGKAVRLTITLTVTALIVATTFWGSDDFFPFAPFKMYSRSQSLDGEAKSTYAEAVDESGARFQLNERNTGFRRAELEGQMPRFRDDPELLGALAQAYEHANPDKPHVVLIEIVVYRYRLEDGVRTGEATETVELSWAREGARA
jgi:hypothetical protein